MSYLYAMVGPYEVTVEPSGGDRVIVRIGREGESSPPASVSDVYLMMDLSLSEARILSDMVGVSTQSWHPLLLTGSDERIVVRGAQLP